MLREISVKNFALVEDMHVRFGDGLNVITGETGSGKSLLVNAISLLLGKKADPAMVRKETDRATIEGVFEWTPPAELSALLEEAGIIPDEENVLILCREISASGRSICRINSRAVTAHLLSDVGAAMADLHGQHQHQTLLRKTDHTEFVDLLGTDSHNKNINTFNSEYALLKNLLKQRRELEENRQRDEEERDLLRFRVDEIEKTVDSEETFEELKTDANRLEHAGEIAGAAHAAWMEISHNGSATSALTRLATAAAKLENLEGLDPRLDRALEFFREAEALLEGASADLRSAAEDSESNPSLLQELEDRIVEVKSLLKKNRCESVTDLLRYRDEALARIEEIDGRDTSMKKLSADITGKKKLVADLAEKISDGRRKIAASLEKRMKSELKDLAMPGAIVSVAFEAAEREDGLPGPMGAETAEFLIAANPGEDPKPLARVASGGELSRVMLAFKTILSRHDPVPVLIFDEIDAGIGGVTANHIGHKLAALGAHHQVLTVTHLPQIAAFGATHVTVFKEKSGKRIVARAGSVQGDDRLREISRMLGDTGAENASINMARELLHNVEKAGAAS